MNANGVVEAYLSTWNSEGEHRAKLIDEHWAPEVAYTDPLAEVSGHAALAELIEGVHQQFPGCVFTRVGDVDAHHSQLRFRWGLGPEGVEPSVVGFDVLVLDGDGRILDVRGFLDKVPAGA
ncbi:nuclear transport factor 2 family protein [Streptomyces sp. DSM 42041]|uniref:Nuclear transport factor 2 family protein n=1 Tax=Streptomyces hazeniae TaxID=3075538 RepID=A0ABU2NRS5_9ACTN|nr:nuclear transport factor 2 family protein [Streptomyces sp. DSM 42041]MDT0378938.1 nuclear transport factor 2 family protein [Streptomyces sp. DSM 42041]